MTPDPQLDTPCDGPGSDVPLALGAALVALDDALTAALEATFPASDPISSLTTTSDRRPLHGEGAKA